MSAGFVLSSLVSGVIALGTAYGVSVFYIKPQRKQLYAQAGSTEATTISTLTGTALQQMEAAVSRAERAEAKAEAAEARLEAIEDEQLKERRRLRALEYELEDLRAFYASPAVATLLANAGLRPPERARLVYDSAAEPYDQDPRGLI